MHKCVLVLEDRENLIIGIGIMIVILLLIPLPAD